MTSFRATFLLGLATVVLASLSADVRAQSPRDDDAAQAIRAALRELNDAALKAGRRPGSAALKPRESTGLVPLVDLKSGTYEGRPGGLYPDGKNTRPAVHEQVGLRAAREVQPRDKDGHPAEDGRIVLLSIGMSNATQEFSTFQRLAATANGLNPRLRLVDGAQGGMTAGIISRPDTPRGTQFWSTVADRLQSADASAAQVQAVWLKEADPAPTGPFPQYAQTLRDELGDVVRLLHGRYPNLKLVYLSSRLYGGYATTRLNPEPYAYHSGFSVKWLIASQIDGAPALNCDASRGPVRAPWLSWGPYLWADGLKPRSDGLTYLATDFGSDGTHPSPAGREKVARQLLEFFQTDSTAKGWFLAR